MLEATTDLNNVTIYGNTADADGDSHGDGGGLFNAAGTVGILNTILAGNLDGSPSSFQPDCALGEEFLFSPNAHNLVGEDTGCEAVFEDGVDGNLVGNGASPLDPGLEPLSDNGGPTFTHALLPFSPAQGAGDSDTCAVNDQRGVVRPEVFPCDIGAFEFPNQPPVAIDDDFIVEEDSTLSVPAPGVLSNDLDVDEDVLTAVLLSSPSHGQLVFSLDGSFIYTPDPNFDGTDSFTYNTFDGFANSASPATFTITVTPDPFIEVTTTDDSGSGSLREAIHKANSLLGDDNIIFELSGSGPFTISLFSPLPTILETVVISGTSNGNAPIVLDGSNAGPGADGLTIEADNSIVLGLEIINFGGSGIVLSGNGNVILDTTIAFNGGNGISILAGVENQITGNDIHDNGGLAIDLGGDGRTPNDVDDPDEGPSFIQNFPVLERAVSLETNLTVLGRLNSISNKTYTIEYFASPTCSLQGSGEQTFIGEDQVAIGEGVDVYFTSSGLDLVPQGYFINATATGPLGNTSEFSDCIVVGEANDVWPRALELPVLENSPLPASSNQYLDHLGQARWYKFKVQPNSRVIVTLTDLPENYDLTIYKDISAAYSSTVSTQDLVRLSAEFASSAFSPSAFSPSAFSPSAFSPSAFSHSAFSPSAFSPSAFSPSAFSPSAFSSAQSRSLIGVSAFEGTSNEGISLSTWNNDDFFYVRVLGREGAFSLAAPFHLEVYELPGECSAVLPITTPSSTVAQAGNFHTLILTDLGRMAGSLDEKNALWDALNIFAGRSEIAGQVINLGDEIGQANCEVEMGDLLRKQGDYMGAGEWLASAQARFEALGDLEGVGQVLHSAGTLAASQGDYATATSRYESSLRIRQELDDRLQIASLMSNLAMLAEFRGDFDQARALNQNALAIRRKLGDRWAIAISVNNLGNVALQQGKIGEARGLLEEAVSLQRQIGDHWYLANALNNLGNAVRDQGDYEAATTLYQESLLLNQNLGDKRALAYLLEDLGCLAITENHLARALVLVEAADQLRREIGAPLSSAEREKLDNNLAKARQPLDELAIDSAQKKGRDMSLDQVVAYVISGISE